MSFGVSGDEIGSAVKSLAQQWCLKRGEEGKLRARQGLSRGLLSLDGMVDGRTGSMKWKCLLAMLKFELLVFENLCLL